MARILACNFALQGLVFLVMGAVGVTTLRRGELMNMTTSKTIDYRELVPARVIFGDSTVDAGNNNYLLTLVKCNFAPYGRQFQVGTATGRFCDRKTTVDFITERLGFPLGLPYLAPNAHGNAILTASTSHLRLLAGTMPRPPLLLLRFLQCVAGTQADQAGNNAIAVVRMMNVTGGNASNSESSSDEEEEGDVTGTPDQPSQSKKPVLKVRCTALG